MAKNPSTRWYFNDHDNDKGLQACGFAAQGFWMRLLGICAENSGVLLINGKPPSTRDLARLFGKPHATIMRLLGELEAHDVFSRNHEGVIFCRRMVRENGTQKRRVPLKKTDREQDTNQPELFDNPTPKSAKPNAPLDSGTFGASTDSPISDERTSESDAAGEGEKISRRNPRGAAARHLDRADARPVKGPAMKLKVKQQLTWKHCRFLLREGAPGEYAAYFAAIDGETQLPPQEIFDAVDRRMRRAHWDDMREWKRQNGVAA
jgi:hypothetical protein